MEKPIEHTKVGAVSVLTMVARPHNFMNAELFESILAALTEAEQSGARAVVLRSGLRNFSAGARVEYLEEMAEAAQANSDRAFPKHSFEFLEKFTSFKLPVIASVHGVCVGGGLELASACDMVIAAKSAKLGCVESSVGLHPLMGAVQRIAQRAGELRANEMALLGRRYDAETLERWGLLNLVVAEDQLESATMTIASEIAAGPTVAHIATKALVKVAVNGGVKAADAAMAQLQMPIWKSGDVRLGIASYRSGDVGLAVFEGR